MSGDAILNGGLVKSTVLPEDSHSYSGLGYAVARMAGGEEAAKTLGNVNEQLFLRTNGKGWLRAGVDEVSSSMIEGEIRKLLEIEQEEELGGFWEKYLLQPLKICSVLENNPVELTREQINMEDTRAYADGFRIGEKVNLGIREITQNLQTVVEKIYSNAKASLEEYGPGIMECLFSGSECEHSISSILNQGFEELEKVRKRKKRRPLQYIVGALSEQMAQERIEDWKNHFKLAVESEIRAKIALHFVSEEGEWDRLLVTPLKRLVESCTAMVKELDKESVVQRPNQETSAPEPEQMQDGAHVVDMGSCEFISSWLKEQNSGQILPAQMLKLKKELIHHLMQQARGKKSDQTVSEIVINAVTDKKVTLADYFTSFTLEHTEEEAQEMFRDFANSCIMHLVDKGKPVLNMDFDSQNRNLWMLLPQKVVKGEYSNRFLQELAKYLDTSYRASYAILASANEDEIVCYQSSVANPLYELSDLPKWEQCYNKRMETETLDWQHYFPLALRHLNKNAVNKKFYEDFFVRTVEFALEEKIIERKVFPGEEKKYLYVMNLLPNSWTNLNISNYKVGDVDGRAKKGEPFFEYLHSMNSFTTDVWQKEIILPGSGVFSKPYDFSEAPYGVDIEDISLRYMKRILQKNIPLFVELRATVGKYRRMKRDIDALWIAPETVVEIPVQSETLEPERTDIAETPETHTTPLKRRKFCKYCRYKLERGTEKYCPKCGRQLQ